VRGALEQADWGNRPHPVAAPRKSALTLLGCRPLLGRLVGHWPWGLAIGIGVREVFGATVGFPASLLGNGLWPCRISAD